MVGVGVSVLVGLGVGQFGVPNSTVEHSIHELYTVNELKFKNKLGSALVIVTQPSKRPLSATK